MIAGIVVGIVALPLSIAFAIASGVTPDRGLYTAIVAGFVISLLGGSRVQIGGPTGAFVVIVYGIVQLHGVDGLLLATLMAGIILVALGLSGLGKAIKFVPQPVVLGFTSGIALIIFSGQIKDLAGIRMGDVPADFIAKWTAYASHTHAINLSAIFIAAAALAIMAIWPKVSRRIPGPFVALILTTCLAHFAHMRVETIADRFGTISSALPMPHLPHVSFTLIRALSPAAFTIALLGGIESLLSAVVADGMIGGRHRSNMELVAVGIANIASPLFGGIPATGAIARTATNVKNGGRTPVAGIVHALTVLLITLFFGRLAGYIPFATLAAILIVVAYHMSEWRGFIGEFSAPRSDTAVMLVTFFLTVLVNLTIALQVGMVLAAFLFMKRMSEVTNIDVLQAGMRDDEGDDDDDMRRNIPHGVQVFEISGPFFFGAAQMFKERIESERDSSILILRMRNVPVIDSTALHALREVARQSHREKKVMLICDVQEIPLLTLRRSEALEVIGDENIFVSYDEAIAHARTLLNH